MVLPHRLEGEKLDIRLIMSNRWLPAVGFLP